MEEESQNWLPLESNPEAINDYVNKLGFSTENYCFHELIAFEEWAEEMIPNPVIGGLLLFPITPKIEEFCKEESTLENYPKDLFYMKQTAKNACGTIGLLHILSNLPIEVQAEIRPGSYLETFISDTKTLNSQEAGEYFCKNKSLKQVHKEAVEKGETKVEDEADNHFIAFVRNNSGDGERLYELDGCKNGPVDHGAVPEGKLLNSIIASMRKFMERDPEEMRFSAIILAGKAN